MNVKVCFFNFKFIWYFTNYNVPQIILFKATRIEFNVLSQCNDDLSNTFPKFTLFNKWLRMHLRRNNWRGTPGGKLSYMIYKGNTILLWDFQSFRRLIDWLNIYISMTLSTMHKWGFPLFSMFENTR